MAKINFGGVVQDARGKQNGLVYSKNKSGAYVRRKVTPANPRSAAQQNVRSNFAVLSQAWSGTLDDAARASWIGFANTYPRLDIFGAAIQISGLNMFLSLNQRLLQVAEPMAFTPPASNVVTPVPIDITSFIATVAGPTLSFAQTAVAAANTEFYIFACRLLPAGRTIQKSDWRFLERLTPAVATFPHVMNVAAAWNALFGGISADMRVGILVASIDTTSGLVSVAQQLEAVVS